MPEYIPYGPMWEQEMKQFTKDQLINKLRQAYIKEENGSSHNTASTQSTGYECGCECQCSCHSR